MSRRGRHAAAAIVAAGFLALVSCGLVTGSAAAANTDFNILVGAEAGRIGLVAIGPYQAHVDLFEIVGDRQQLVRTLSLDNRFVKDGREQGYVLLDSIAGWRCDRRTRSFVAFATTPAGKVFSSDVSQARTPSCAKRFKLTVPRRVRPGRRFKATVTDTWTLGGQKPRLCVRAPGATRPSCRGLAIAAGRTKASRSFTLRERGRWRLDLRTSRQRTRRTIAVGVRASGGRDRSVLLLGDSMMSQLVDPIGHDLGSGVDTDTLLEGGGRLTDPNFDWYRSARRRIASLKPAAAAILIVGGDGFPFRLNGALVECCSETWINAYANRVVAMMRTLRRGGRTRVVWILYPAPENAATRQVLSAVNIAITRAEPRVRNVVIADLNPSISPGFVFRESATVNGRVVRLRASDGIHFTLQGAIIAAREIVRTIGRLR